MLLNHAREPTWAVWHGRQSPMVVWGSWLSLSIPTPAMMSARGRLGLTSSFEALDASDLFFRMLLPEGTCSSPRRLSCGEIPTPNEQTGGVQRSPPPRDRPAKKKPYIDLLTYCKVKAHEKELHRHDSGQHREMSAGFFENPDISVVFLVDERNGCRC